MRRTHILSFLLLTAGSIFAQYNPSIDVEGRYKPEVIDHNRVNMFPATVKPVIPESALRYDLQGVVTPFRPEGVPMAATLWNADDPLLAKRGWLDVKAGSWLDAVVTAGYRVADTRNTSATIFLNHRSTSLWKPYKDSQYYSHQYRRAYDETVGGVFSHSVDGQGTLSAGLKYNFAWFNYYGFDSVIRSFIPESGENYDVMFECPTQTYNDVALGVQWRADRSLRFRVDAEAGVRYSGFRSMYLPDYYQPSMEIGKPARLAELQGGRNTEIHLGIGIAGTMRNPSSSVGVDVAGDVVITGGMSARSLHYGYNDEKLGNYGLVTVVPYYSYSSADWNFRIGPRLDIAINTERIPAPNFYTPGVSEREKGKAFFIAPDVTLGYMGKSFGMEVNLKGGAVLPTLGREHDRDFYNQPGLFASVPVHSPLDASAAFRFGPFAGFQARLSAAYRIVKNQRSGGLYTLFITDPQYFPMADPGTWKEPAYPFDECMSLSGASLGLDLSYEYGPEFRASVGGTWQPQHGKTGYFNGWDLPELTLSARIQSNPWTPLHLELAYDLRALRRPLAPNGLHIDGKMENLNLLLPNWSDLGFSAGYDITPGLRVGVQLHNLLNRRQYILANCPTPGITVLGTLSWRF